MFFAACVGQARKALAHRRKKGQSEGGQDYTKRRNQHAPDSTGIASGPTWRGGILPVLLEFAGFDGTRERGFFGRSGA